MEERGIYGREERSRIYKKGQKDPWLIRKATWTRNNSSQKAIPNNPLAKTSFFLKKEGKKLLKESHFNVFNLKRPSKRRGPRLKA